MIREATIEDLPQMEAAAREFYASSRFLKGFDIGRFIALWTSLLSAGTGVVFLLTDGAERLTGPLSTAILGALGGAAYPDPYSGELIATEFFWFVRREYRGAGMKLYFRFENWAEGKGCKEIRMVHLVDSMPQKLERVYRHLGFEPAEVHYTKELAP